MKKSELLKPGEYAATPLVVLARPDLASTAKTTYMAMVSHLSNGDSWVWPSVARLAAMTAVSTNSVRAAIRALENARLIELDRQKGKVTRYRFLPPTPAETAGVEGPTPAKVEGVNSPRDPESDEIDASTPAKVEGVEGPAPAKVEGVKPLTPAEVEGVNGPDPCNICGGPPQNLVGTPAEVEGEPLKELNQELPPPYPPPRGGCASEVFPTENSSAQKPLRRWEIVKRCDAAHREAFSKPLPAKWKRDIRTEYDDGDRAALGRYDAKVLLGAEEYRKRNGWTCLGHGTVMHYLAHLDRNGDAKRKADQRVATEASTQVQKADEEAREQAEAEKRQSIRLDHFRGLSDAERAGYVEQVSRELRFTRRTDLIERQAALLAWQAYERTSVAVEI